MCKNDNIEVKDNKIEKPKDVEINNRISFLKKYLYSIGISISTFSKMTGISTSDLYNYLNLDRPVLKQDLEKILKVFNKKNINELVEMVNSKITKEKRENERLNEYMINSIDDKKLFYILRSYEITKEEYKTIILIFSKKISHLYKIEELTNMNKSEIYKLFAKCLEIYNNEVNDIDKIEKNEGEKKNFLSIA